MKNKTPKNKDEFPISPAQKAFIYSCLVPVLGFIPSVMALVSDRGSKQLKSTAKISLAMFLGWLITYAALGQDNGQITQELFKGTLTSVYFTVNVYLMYVVSKGKKLKP